MFVNVKVNGVCGRGPSFAPKPLRGGALEGFKGAGGRWKDFVNVKVNVKEVRFRGFMV